jgi:hypothetical protein
MADTLKKLASGTFATVEATLYTVPANTKAIIKSIILCNKNTAAAKYVTLKFAGTEVVFQHAVAAKDTVCLQITGILEAGAVIAGLAESTDVTFYISGIEVA